MEIDTSSNVHELFNEAVEAEEAGRADEAAQIYLDVISIQPNFAPAYLNLGNQHFHQKRYETAASLFRKATEVEPGSCMAHFDYANALEEMGYYDDAIKSYLRAVEIDPAHRDFHYNLALAYQRRNQPREAVQHWRAYAALDTGISKWATVARRQIQKLLESEPLKVVAVNPNPVRTLGSRPMLTRVK